MQKEVNKFLFLCLTFVFLIGVVSAWSVSITNPADNSYYEYQPDLFSWSFSGISQSDLKSTFKINLNNNLYTGVTSSPVGVIEQSDLLEGWNNLKINVTDNTNHSEYSETNFWIDSIYPLLAVLNPLGNIGYTNTNTLNLIVQLTETNPGFYIGTKEILRKFTYPNSGTPNHIREYDLDASNIADASHSLFLGDQEEGKYSYIIYSKDIYPNGSKIREITEEGTIIRDTLSPITLITSPINGNYKGIVNIISYADDDVSVTTDVSGVNNITINITDGILYSNKSSSISSPFNYNWNSDSALTPDGNYIIDVTSYDRAGNSDLETITISIDNTAPTITDDYGFNGIWIGPLNIPQIVTLNPDDGVGSGINNVKYCEEVSCDPSTGTLLNLPYQLPDYNSEQNTIVRYQTWDNVANPSLIGEYNVKIDLTAPIVDAGTAKITNILINQDATASDLLSGIVTWSWTQQVGPGTITFGTPTTEDTTISADIDGTYTIRLTVTDAVGNSAFDEISFTWDTQDPVTTDNSPIGWQANDITITLNPTDTLSGVTNTFYCVDQTDTCVPGTSGISLLVSSEGINFARYYSIDNAGNIESTNSAQVWIDKSAPNVDAGLDKITNILINQDATASDLLSGIVSYSWTQTAGPGAITFGTPTTEDTTISANTDGVYIVQLTVTDLVGNSASDTIQFTWDTTEPDSTINALVPNPNKNNIPTFTGTATDLTTTITNVEYSIDGGVWNIATPTDGAFNSNNEDYTLTTAILTDGIHTIEIRATDLATNIETTYATDTFTIDTISPAITTFQAVPSASISQNNPTTISAVDVSDANLNFTGLMFVDSNNLISSDQILFLANMNETPVNGTYGPINWNADYFKITDGTISEPVSIFVTDFAPTEYIVMGYLQEDPAIPTPTEDCMIRFDMLTNSFLDELCSGIIADGVSTFQVKSLKFTNGILSPPSETNGSEFTLYTLGNPANPKLESVLAPSGDYNLILQVEDSAGNENGTTLNISVDNTYPYLTNINLSSSVISPINADGYLDDLTITMNASELVMNWGTTYIYDSTGAPVFRENSPAGSPDNIYSLNFVWDGKYKYYPPIGNYVPDGVYTINTTITDQAGNSITIVIGSIIVDNTLPTLSGISATSIGTSSASIIWTTNENANSNVSYGTTILTTSNLGSATQITSHSISLSSLSASTFYYFNVTSCDASKNCGTSTQYNFTTSAQSGDDGGAGGGGGGGGGGGNSLTYYACSKWSEWSTCANNEQTRVCSEKITTTSSKGVIASQFKDKETKACTTALTPLSSPTAATEKTEIGAPIEPSEKTPTFIGRITGGITGAAVGFSKSKGGKISLIVIAVLALAFGSLVLIRKKLNKNKERKIRIIHKSDLGKR